MVFCSPNIAALPSIMQCSCANCSEQVAPELADCNYISFNKSVDFNIFLAERYCQTILVALQYSYQRKSARKELKSTNLLKLI